MSCENCGDGSGWVPVPVELVEGAEEDLLPCLECNPDGNKSKPELCTSCGEPLDNCECGFDPLWEE